MKIFAAVGSPRKGGATDMLVREVLRGLSIPGNESRLLHLNDLDFKGCQGCQACKVTGECVQVDELSPYLPDFEAADYYVIGSPIYAWNISGQTKLFIDRLYQFYNLDGSTSFARQEKRAVLIFTQGNEDPAAYQSSIDTTAAVFQFFGIKIADILIVPGMTSQNALDHDPLSTHMAHAYEIGKRLAH